MNCWRINAYKRMHRKKRAYYEQKAKAVPRFASEVEERAFWETTGSTAYMTGARRSVYSCRT